MRSRSARPITSTRRESGNVAEITLTPRPLLSGETVIGDTRMAERADLALVSVAIPQGGAAGVAAALKSGFGLEMPGPRMSSASGESRALMTSPDQLLLILLDDGDPAGAVAAALNGTGYVTDQTDAWLRLELSGPLTGPALERLSMVDLSPTAFPTGAFARTVMEHMGAIALRLGEDHFLLLSASSSARSFAHGVETSLHNVA